ncbi:translocator protein homolog [Nymphaea colorata]|uniref:Uncharacterized protein n=1 Tax=Nymphaea colorata TaxID=210225 RepID=A0A5K0XC83_9MAGN|nr:translocator protein homolog [Nymphaea colorata]
MESSDLKHRVRDESRLSSGDVRSKNPRANKMALAKRGLRSLAVAVAIPFLLGCVNLRLGDRHLRDRSVWCPVWLHDFGWLVSCATMGLSSWLVWVEGGLQQQSGALSVYAAELGLSFVWALAFGFGATRFAFAISLLLVGLAVVCYRSFRSANPIAGDLVKPYLFWVAFVAFVNYRLL